MEIKPLHYVEAEASYLGCCLNAGVAPECPPGDFYLEGHKVIATAMLDLEKSGSPIELVTVHEQSLKLAGRAVDLSDITKLMDCMPAEPSQSSFDSYLRSIRSTAAVRRLQHGCLAIVTELNTIKSADALAYLEKAESRIQLLFNHRTDTTAKLTDSLKRVIDKIERRREEGMSVFGISSGLRELDRLTCGLCPGDYVVVAARPSMGKTAFALGMTRYAAKKGHSVLFCSLEMGEEALTMRMVAQEANLNTVKVRSGQLTNEEYASFLKASGKLNELPITMNFASSASELDIAHLVKRHKPDLFIVDYVGLLRCSEGGDKNVIRERQVSIISAAMKRVAKEMEIPAVILSQLNRDLEKASREPRLSDLRESGSLEQDADLVIFLHAEKKEDPVRQIIIAKNRNGPCGSFKCSFTPRSASFQLSGTDH